MTVEIARPEKVDSARVAGPSAFGGGGGIRRFFELTLTLAKTEFKLRYFGSVLGYVWSLMRPLLFFGALYVVFTKVFHIGRGIPHYAVYMLLGIVMWNYFLEATSGAMPALVAREGLLRKIRFPRLVVPLSVSLTAVFNLAMNLIAVFVFALANGLSPRLSWLELIPIVGAYIVLATAVGMFLCALYVQYRDIAPIWEVLSQVLFYGSAIIYPVVYLRSTGIERYALLNPITMLNTQMGHAVIGTVPLTGPDLAVYGPYAWQSPAQIMGWGHMVIPSVILVGVFAVGSWFFIHAAPRVAEHL